jgi:hypothetical protein
MPRYLEILAIQSPFPYGLDEAKRVLYSCNFLITVTHPAPTLEENIITILSSLGLTITFNSDVFIGPAAQLPSGPGPYTSLIATGGTDPSETHTHDKYDRPTLQTITRALSFTAARTRAYAIYSKLDGARNITVA